MQNLAVLNHSPNPSAETFTVHTLFVDVVGYSRLKIEEQRLVQGELRALFEATVPVQKALRDNRLIRRPTGDGMAVLFRAHADCTIEDAVQCALAVDLALRQKQVRKSRGVFSFRLRMGIHTGEVSGQMDVNGTLDVAGDGIIYGQRVMDCGDAGHILLSAKSATLLRQIAPDLAVSLGDLGIVRIKNDQLLHVHSLYGTHPDETPFGNEVLPKAVANSRKAQAERERETEKRNRRDAASETWGGARRSVWMVLAAVVVSLAVHNSLLASAPWYKDYIRAREKGAWAAVAGTFPQSFGDKSRRVTVPDVSTTGLSLEEATQRAGFVGLTIVNRGSDYDDYMDAGLIYKQHPDANTKAKRGDVIYVRVSKGRDSSLTRRDMPYAPTAHVRDTAPQYRNQRNAKPSAPSMPQPNANEFPYQEEKSPESPLDETLQNGNDSPAEDSDIQPIEKPNEPAPTPKPPAEAGQPEDQPH